MNPHLPDTAGLVRRYDHLYYIRYSNPADPAFGIIRIFKPGGGMITSLPDHSIYWADLDLREKLFPGLVILDDVPVSAAVYAIYQAFALAMLSQAFSAYAGSLLELIGVSPTDPTDSERLPL